MSLYFLTTALFIFMAIVAAVDAALISYNVLPWFNGLRWLRIHLITLGAITEAFYGLLPIAVALRAGLPRPSFRWDIWLTLNGGLLTLLIGIPIINQPLILLGGTLVFMATILLMIQLKGIRSVKIASSAKGTHIRAGRKFYIVGLGYFLLGIILGTGLWLGWSAILRVQVPIEVHIHANNWGFLSLVFAGLIVDFYQTWTKRPLAWPRSVSPIFWMMTIGAFGLVLGPWFKSNLFSVPGLLLHLTATIWLLLNVIKPLLKDGQAWARPGIWHLVTAYFWILAPIFMAPLIIMGIPGFPGAGIEQNAPQALVYGWVLQFGFAILPYFFRRTFLPNEPARLGGSWFSLTAIHLGCVFLWANIFIIDYQTVLHGTAYLLWAAAMVPIAIDLWRIIRSGLGGLDDTDDALSLAKSL